VQDPLKVTVLVDFQQAQAVNHGDPQLQAQVGEDFYSMLPSSDVFWKSEEFKLCLPVLYWLQGNACFL
jgi:hypothetical protein